MGKVDVGTMTSSERRDAADLRIQQAVNALSANKRQVLQERKNRVQAVPDDQKLAFRESSRLAALARAINKSVGADLSFSDIFNQLSSQEVIDVKWLAAQIAAETQG